MTSGFEPVIGLEVHCQLSTESKLFCGCRARLSTGKSVSEEAVNINTCPVCTSQPGSLPVLNKKAVEYAIKAGLATQCKIQPKSVFARKNYFYPDLPKGYQISQYDLPICLNGHLDVVLSSGETKRISIQRIHIEEDAGKNVHLSNYSLVNLNRAGVPLIEIVTGPDMRGPEEAGSYLRTLYGVVTYLGISDGNLQEGNFRCDANVSVRPVGQKEFGTRVEIKNVNSFKFIEKAIEFEINRQIEVIKAGGKIIQETRTYDSAKGVTISMRTKEEAQDYRYFPEPDLIPLQVESEWVEKVRTILPELPNEKTARYVKNFKLSTYDAGVLTSSKSMASYFEETVVLLEKAGVKADKAAKPAANWITGELSRLLNENNVEISEIKVKPKNIATLVQLVLDSTISSTGAKQVLGECWNSGEEIEKIVDRLGIRQVSDFGALEPVVDKVLADNPGQVEQYRSGKEKLFGYFVGQVMKETGGKANPKLLQDLIRKKLKG